MTWKLVRENLPRRFCWVLARHHSWMRFSFDEACILMCFFSCAVARAKTPENLHLCDQYANPLSMLSVKTEDNFMVNLRSVSGNGMSIQIPLSNFLHMNGIFKIFLETFLKNTH